MRFEDLKPVKFKDLEEGSEFWQARYATIPQRMEELLGPYSVYTATGHVLNKLFRLPKRLEDHELVNVAEHPETHELYLMEPLAIVYVNTSQSNMQGGNS